MPGLKLPQLSLGRLDKYGPPALPSVKPTATLINISTYFTVPGETKLLYTAESWVEARLMLEDAGPVAIGHSQNLVPVLSGRGMLLPTNEWVKFPLTKGNRIFIAAESINRVKFIIAPVPFADDIPRGFGAVIGALHALGSLFGRHR